jgi:hypothetical protein
MVSQFGEVCAGALNGAVIICAVSELDTDHNQLDTDHNQLGSIAL